MSAHVAESPPTRACSICGEPLDAWSRADRRTCSMRCHVAAWRARGRTNGSSLVHDATPRVKGPSTAIAAVTSASEPRAA